MVENIEERAQRLLLLGVVMVCKEQELMFDSDPDAKKRTWGWVFAQVLSTKSTETDNHRRWSVATIL